MSRHRMIYFKAKESLQFVNYYNLFTAFYFKASYELPFLSLKWKASVQAFTTFPILYSVLSQLVLCELGYFFIH